MFFLSALVLALLAAFGVELNSSNNYANGASVRELSNSTLNLVMGLIATATSGVNTSTDGNGSTNLDWASQPGMIRTFDTTGSLVNAYKLYSSPTLVLNSGNFSTTNEVSAMANWSYWPAHFADLNSPIIQTFSNTSSTNVYPILDPNAVDPNVTSSPSAPTQGVEGFWFGTFTTSNVTFGNFSNPAGVSNGNMPVMWLYVLKDGTITPPDVPSGSKPATDIATVSAATTANPIVGRIAFWTDDETCKVNINTASAGYFSQTGSSVSTTNSNPWNQTFWDTPRAFTYADRNLGKYQPYQNEFQRYPGHPAMTDLPTALPASLSQMPSSPTSTQVISYANSVYNLTPRYNSSGGSQVASVAVPTNTSSLSPMSIVYNRLYNSIDELMFSPSRGSQTISATSSQTITAAQLEQSRFFITASSRAPEVNIYNQPRIACWPINSNTSLRTASDQTIAFCATLNGSGASAGSSNSYPYYFQRSDPTSPTNDYANISRNQSLFSYLQYLTALPVPGFGGGNGAHRNPTYGLNSKYNANGERDQILTEIFDYIRCININDTSTGATPFASSGQVVPIELTAAQTTTSNTMGFGRFAVPFEIGMDFVCVGKGVQGTNAAVPVQAAQANLVSYTGGAGGTTPSTSNDAIEAILIMSFMNPATGTPSYHPNFTVQVTGMNTFLIGGKAAGFPASGANYITSGTVTGTNVAFGVTSGGILDPVNSFVPNKYFNQSTFTTTNFPFYSKIIEVPVIAAKTFTFTGGKIGISVFEGNSTAAANLIQSITNVPIMTTATTLNLPGMPNPGLILMGTGGPGYTTSTNAADKFISSPASSDQRTFFGWDYAVSSSNSAGAQDNVQSVVLTSGDARMAFRQNIDNTASSTSVGTLSLWGADNSSSSAGVDASFVGLTGDKNPYQQCTSGSLVFGASPQYFGQFVPHTISGTYVGQINSTSTNNPLGDWDSGEPNMQDGPYINKVDEGDLTSTNSYTPYYPGWTSYTPVVNSYFSPNRMMPSSGMFGSLPTGVAENKPWQTLLFHPDNSYSSSASVGTTHPGAGAFSGSYSGGANDPFPYTTVPDHLFMDLFWMPVVEPYPISEPFSTAGKVNMNYQIMPFAFINRETAIRAVLKWERPIAIPSNPGTAVGSNATIEKAWKDMNELDNENSSLEPGFAALATDWRYSINLDQTLVGFRQRFAAGDLFRSASEICLIPLVPKDNPGSGYFNPNSNPAETYADMLAPATSSYSTSFWYNHALTGDNLRERPYANIYPRLTTKSNTYTVHYWVQTLKKASTTPANEFVTGTDLVTGEFRGSSIIERYIDPNITVNDYATLQSSALPLSSYYKYRVVSTKQFNP